jgi:hypothetical protein
VRKEYDQIDVGEYEIKNLPKPKGDNDVHPLYGNYDIITGELDNYVRWSNATEDEAYDYMDKYMGV